MDPITVGAVAISWLAAMAGGSLLTIGMMEVLTGRALINLNRVNWSSHEATLFGLTRVVQGLCFGLYGLIGVLFVGRVIGFPVLPTPWGLFASFPLYLILLATFIAQGLIAARNHRRAKS